MSILDDPRQFDDDNEPWRVVAVFNRPRSASGSIGAGVRQRLLVFPDNPPASEPGEGADLSKFQNVLVGQFDLAKVAARETDWLPALTRMF
jgi:hypothetical protein